MKDKKVFYQDFLMDIPCEKDYPIVKLKYIDSIYNYASFDEKDNLLDYIDGKIRTISLGYLHNLLEEKEWHILYEMVKKFHKLIIVDDIFVINEEVKPIKDFYLKVYYYNLNIYVDCYVFKSTAV